MLLVLKGSNKTLKNNEPLRGAISIDFSATLGMTSQILLECLNIETACV